MVRQIFRKRVIAAAGPLPGQLIPENLKRWTHLRRGVFSDEFDETVTHLLCTEEQFNKRVPRVREALARGKSFHIVHYDWFEFSLVDERRLPEREYSMRNILSKENAIKREKARVEKGKRDGEKFVNTNYYHIYHDREFFPYKVDITRDDEQAGEIGQRYTLCLWESNAKPHLYWFTAKFLKRKGDGQPSYYRPSPCSGRWRHEMGLFMEFFRIKTGIDWEDRVIKQGTTPLSVFQYSPPTGGKPVGRRLRHSHDYCLEINAQLRGLPWPPSQGAAVTTSVGDKGEADDAKTRPRDGSEEDDRIEENDGKDKEHSSLATDMNKDVDDDEEEHSSSNTAMDEDDQTVTVGNDGVSDDQAQDKEEAGDSKKPESDGSQENDEDEEARTLQFRHEHGRRWPNGDSQRRTKALDDQAQPLAAHLAETEEHHRLMTT